MTAACRGVPATQQVAATGPRPAAIAAALLAAAAVPPRQTTVSARQRAQSFFANELI